MQKNLEDWVVRCRKKGWSHTHIADAMRKHGYSEKRVGEALTLYHGSNGKKPRGRIVFLIAAVLVLIAVAYLLLPPQSPPDNGPREITTPSVHYYSCNDFSEQVRMEGFRFTRESSCVRMANLPENIREIRIQVKAATQLPKPEYQSVSTTFQVPDASSFEELEDDKEYVFIQKITIESTGETRSGELMFTGRLIKESISLRKALEPGQPDINVPGATFESYYEEGNLFGYTYKLTSGIPVMYLTFGEISELDNVFQQLIESAEQEIIFDLGNKQSSGIATIEIISNGYEGEILLEDITFSST